MVCEFSKIEDCHKKCEWTIKSPEHNNCFWTYIFDKSDDYGVMTPLPQAKIISLLGIKSSVAVLVIHQAFLELEAILPREQLGEWLDEVEDTGFEKFSFIKDSPNSP